jgi:hypothetical protein
VTKRIIQNRFRIYIECIQCGRTLEVSTNPVTRIKILKRSNWKEFIISETKTSWKCPNCHGMNAYIQKEM